MNENIAQVEELEVLTSIFGDQWKKCPELSDTYTIRIAQDVELWVTLNEHYPSERPPGYDLWAPNLSRNQRDLIDKEFSEIYNMDKGYPIIFQWIEKLKDIVEGSKAESNSNDDEDFNEPTTNLLDLMDEQVWTKPSKDAKAKKNVIELNIIHGATITDRKSTFQGHVCRVTHPSQVNQMIDTLFENKKIREAKHNIRAYVIKDVERNCIIKECDDDGENLAGGRLLHLLEILDLKNVAVVVTRWYGGIHLGPDRFKHINNAARQALLEGGFISS